MHIDRQVALLCHIYPESWGYLYLRFNVIEFHLSIDMWDTYYEKINSFNFGIDRHKGGAAMLHFSISGYW